MEVFWPLCLTTVCQALRVPTFKLLFSSCSNETFPCPLYYFPEYCRTYCSHSYQTRVHKRNGEQKVERKKKAE